MLLERKNEHDAEQIVEHQKTLAPYARGNYSRESLSRISESGRAVSREYRDAAEDILTLEEKIDRRKEEIKGHESVVAAINPVTNYPEICALSTRNDDKGKRRHMDNAMYEEMRSHKGTFAAELHHDAFLLGLRDTLEPAMPPIKGGAGAAKRRRPGSDNE
jgi:hypothetical protein